MAHFRRLHRLGTQLSSTFTAAGIALLEHVNINSADFDQPAQYFFDTLGMVPASYCSPSIIHANMGLSQIHMPIDVDTPQTWTGTIGLAYSRPEFDALWDKLRNQSQWAAEKISDCEIATIGPHGNRYHLHVVDDAWVDASRTRGSIHRGVTDEQGNTCDGDDSRCAGMLYVTVNVAPGKAARVAGFYRAAFSALPVVEPIGDGRHKCTVPIGTPDHQQSIIYVDTEGEIPQYDGHHLAIYLNDYPGGYTASDTNGLICASFAFT